MSTDRSLEVDAGYLASIQATCPCCKFTFFTSATRNDGYCSSLCVDRTTDKAQLLVDRMIRERSKRRPEPLDPGHAVAMMLSSVVDLDHGSLLELAARW